MPEKVTKLVVKDVMGPLPASGSALVFLLTQEGRMLALSCCLSDADACRKSLYGDSDRSNPYHCMIDLLGAVGLELAEARLETGSSEPYSRILFKRKEGFPLKIINPNPMFAVNLSLAAGVQLLGTEALASRMDVLAHYGHLKSEFQALWPLSDIKYSGQLAVLSDLMDEVSCEKNLAT